MGIWWFSFFFLFFFCLRLEILFWGKFGPKKSKWSILAEIENLNYFEYAKLNGGVHFFKFRMKMRFLEKFEPRN